MTNYFEQVADRQLTNPQKVKERTKQKWADKRAKKTGEDGAPMMPTWQEKMRAEDAMLSKLYRRWRAELKQKVIDEHGQEFKELMRLLRKLEWATAHKVVEFVEEATWLRQADDDTKFATLGYIHDHLIRSRVRQGLAPLDDPMPDSGEEPQAFQKIRKILFGY